MSLSIFAFCSIKCFAVGRSQVAEIRLEEGQSLTVDLLLLDLA